MNSVYCAFYQLIVAYIMRLTIWQKWQATG